MPYYIGKQAELEQLERLKANWIRQRGVYEQLAMKRQRSSDFAYYSERVTYCNRAIKSLTDQIHKLRYIG